MFSSKPEERRQASVAGLGGWRRFSLETVLSLTHRLVTDISAGGVRIHINGFKVPDEFVLLFPGDGPTQSGNYKVAWRRDQDVGAKFIGAG